MPKPQTRWGNQIVSSRRLPFVPFAVVAWMLVVVTHSAPQQAQVSLAEIDTLQRIPQSESPTVENVDVPSSTDVQLAWNPLVIDPIEPTVQNQIQPIPNPPERFVVWYRNETALLIYWQPPSGQFDSYKAEINPRASEESRILVSKEDYQTGELTPGFYDLTPGKAYNISVMTISGNLESKPLVKEYRTVPLKPENITVAVGELKNRPSSITVEWLPPPEDEGDYDGFNVYINHPGSKPVQKFVPRTKPPRAHLSDPSLEIGGTYEVIVKTVSGKVSSASVSHNFTFIPKPLN